MDRSTSEIQRKLEFRLEGPVPMPWDLRHLWQWFNELSAARGGGMGPSPITYQDILAWSRLTGHRPSPWDVSVLRDLDDLWLSIMPTTETAPNPLIKDDGAIDVDELRGRVDRFFDMMGIPEVGKKEA